MAARRLLAPVSPASIQVDGETVTGAAGEPVAVSLLASGRYVLGRSVKYHRPRGAYCFAGRCDGCLMRVDGVGNVMTCMVPLRDGMKIETQNVVGSAERDLLSVTDWFFPTGIDHHHMFTRFKPLNKVMQKVARRIAGIGELPDETLGVRPATVLKADVLVVGGGPGGLMAAAALSRVGRRVTLIEDAEELGGQLRFRVSDVTDQEGRSRRPLEVASDLVNQVQALGVNCLVGHVAVGVYDGRVLVQGPNGLLVSEPDLLVFATGAHEGAAGFEGNDLPGVFGLRAATRLLRHGVLAGELVVVAGGSEESAAFARAVSAAGAEVASSPAPSDLLAALGGTQIEKVRVRDIRAGEQPRERTVKCDALVVESQVSGAYELAVQAGAEVRFKAGRYQVRGAPNVAVLGEVAGEFPLSEKEAAAIEIAKVYQRV